MKKFYILYYIIFDYILYFIITSIFYALTSCATVF